MSTGSHQTVQISRGRHASASSGACVMELASMLAGERFSDRPRSVDPVIAALLRAINDRLDDQRRRLLYPYAAAAVGTSGPEAVRLARLHRCQREMSARQAERGLLRRVVTSASETVGHLPSLIELDSFMWHLLRAMGGSGRDWARPALALVDELIAMGAERGVRTRAATARQGAPASEATKAYDARAAVDG